MVNRIPITPKPYSQHYFSISERRWKIELLRQMNRTEDANNTEKQYLHLPRIREKALRYCMETSQYDKAITHAEEGIAMSSATSGYMHPTHWRKLLQEVYEKMNNREKLLEVTRELFINEGGRRNTTKNSRC